jgi:hypothetical protein
MECRGALDKNTKGSSSDVVGASLNVHTRFTLHKTRQLTDLLHLSAHRLAMWTRPRL